MADRVIGNLTIRLDFDGAKFEQGMTQAKRELASYGKATKMSTNIARQDNYEKGKTLDALNNMQVRYKGLNSMVQVYAKENERLGKLEGDHTGKMAKNAQQMQNMQYEMYELNEEYKRFQKEAFTAQSAFTKVGNVAESVGSGMVRLGGGISQVGAGFTKLGAMATGSIGVVTKMAMDFESGMIQVQKTTNASAEEMVVLEQDIRNLALAMPLAVGELQELAATAGRLGIAQGDIAEFTEVMAKLGTATNLSSEQASESMARFINITGSGAKDLDNLGSALVHLGNNLATSESEIMGLSMGLAGSLTTVGASEYQIMALAGAMSAMGISAERGASSMSKFFVDIASDVASGSDRLETFAKISNMSVDQFVQAFQEDAVGAVQAFITGLGNVEESGGDMLSVLGELEIGEVRLRDTLLRLANGHDVLNESMELGRKGFEEGVALNNEYETQLGSTASQVELAKNQLYDLGITIGQELLPAILDLLNNSDGLVDWLKEAVDWFVNLDDELKQNIVKWSAMSLVLGPVLSGFGNVVSGLGSMVQLFGSASTGLGKLSGALRSKLAPDLIEITGGLTTATTATSAFGEGAVVASGSKGVGALIAKLSGSAGLPWALGIAGVALAGWTWWKVWGEDAHEASEQTKRWGTTVSGVTDEVLTDVQGNIESTTGKFGLMAQGFNVDSDSMVGDLRKIGESIEGDLNRRLELTEEYLGNLPSILRNSQEEILQDYQTQLSETLNLTQENTAKVQEIQDRASNEKRKLTKNELDYIRELQNESLSEYITTLNLSAEEEKNIRQALTGDITQTTKEQGSQMLALLSQQEKAMGETRRQAIEETKQFLKENNISPESKMGQELLSDVNRYYDALSVSGQRTMHELVQLYPELINEIDLQTGKMLNRQQRDYDERVEMNKALMETWEKSHRDMSKAAAEADKTSSYIVETSKAGAKEWNDIVVASGDNVDEFRKQLTEATKDSQTWNDIRLQVHNADLDSNAKLIIGEAAIANGWWDGMAWEDKMAVLEDNFSEVVYKAIVDEGTWDKLSWEERIAVLNNEFSDGVAQAIMDEGKWRDLPWEEKKAILTTNSPKTLKQILKDIGVWNTLPIKVRELLADGSQVNRTVDNAQRKINSLRGKSVTLETRKRTVYETVRRAGNSASSQRFAQSGGQILHERGTNFHPGGLATVNDQAGSLFRELITLPDGEQFIPEGRNVLIDLPKGSKVLRSALTKHLFPDLPQYEHGSGLQTTTVPKGFGEMRTTNNSSNDTYNIYITANGDLPDSTIKKMAGKIEQEIKNINDRKRSSRGERVSFG